MNYPPFVCPRCKSPVQLEAEIYQCLECPHSYPIVLGIPDFRIFPDRYISVEDDTQKATFLLEQAKKDNLDFEGLVRLYWKITPNVTPERAERFAQRVFALVEKGRENLREIESMDRLDNVDIRKNVLEIGCGTGGFLTAAQGKFSRVVGCDIAFRWLVIARERHREMGLQLPLVCCCAEALPFAEGSFDLVVAENVLEHVTDQDKTVGECQRVLRDQGALFLTTPNRFSLAPEPHVGVWGVGFLPRRWMSPYVQLIKRTPYQFLKVLALGELKGLLRRHRFQHLQITLPGLPQAEVERFGPRERLAIKVYDVARRAPVLRTILYCIGPSFHVLCRARKSSRKVETALP